MQRLLGTGSFGVVYEAFDSYRNRTVALKTLTRADADSVARFKREFRSLAELRHENLASLYELFMLDHEWTLSMELIRGTDLLEHLSFAEIQSAFLDPDPSAVPFDPDARISLPRRSVKEGKLSENYVRNVRDSFRQLAEALAFLHANGVVHRDVKPSNVMITPEGRVVLLDFGLAIDARSDPSLDHDLIVGTPGFMSPEQITMAGPAPSSDWYSFGMMLYQALTGWGLFAGASMAEILVRQLRETHVPARDVLPGLPEDLCMLSDRCLARDPAQRPSEGEILEVLGSSLLQARGDLRGRDRPTELIGRDREVHTLIGHVKAVAAAGSGMVLLHGSPGVGKSVLADRMLDEVRATTDALILGACCHGWESLPFNAIDAVVDSVARAARMESSPAVAEVLGRSVAMTHVFPTLAFHDGPASGEETIVMPASAAKVMALGAIELQSLLEALARGRPVVLFLDDAQWGDYQSAEVFARLLDGSTGASIVLVLCYSTEDWRTSLLLQALLSMQIPRRELRIDALSPPQSQRLARRELPDSSRSARHVAAQQSEGNPALLHHIVRYIAGDGSAEPLLARAVAARLAGLSPSAQRIYSLLRDADGPLPEEEVERRLELFESDEPLRTLTRSRLVRLRRTGDLFELDLYHPRLRA